MARLIGFHEASHGMLRKNRLLNELDGLIIGTLSFMSFTLYRAAHQTHHSHLATERDEELWPLCDRDSPRWTRRLAAFIELNAGIAVHALPILAHLFPERIRFIRSKKVRRRIWMEFVLIVVVWTAILAASPGCHVGLFHVAVFWRRRSSPVISRAGGNTSSTSA